MLGARSSPLLQSPSIREFCLPPSTQGCRVPDVFRTPQSIPEAGPTWLGRQSLGSWTIMSDKRHQSLLVGPLRPSWFPDLLSLLLRDWSTSPALLVSPGFASRGSLLFLSALQSSSASSAPKSTGKYCAPVMAAPASLGQRPTGFKTAPPVGGPGAVLPHPLLARQATHP